MSDRRVSSHWPDYFRYDCAVGTDRAAPIAQALDCAVETAAHESLRSGFAVRPDLWPIDSVRRALDALGFPADVLDDLAARALYDLRGALLAHRGSIRAVRLLAEAYLGEVEVSRGSATIALPLPATGAERLVVADVPSAPAMLLVRPKRAAPEATKAAFAKACSGLVPEGTRVRIASPASERRSERHGYETAPAPLVQRRI